MATSPSIARDQLKGFVTRIENIRGEKQDLADDEKAVFAEAKAAGFDTKVLRRVLKRREVTKAEREEFDSLVDAYEHALGTAEPVPLFRHVGLMAVDTMARDQVIKAFGELVPPDGEIIVRPPGTTAIRISADEEGTVSAEDWFEPKPAPFDPKSSSGSGSAKKDASHLRAEKGGKPEPSLADARRMGAAAGRDLSTEKNPFPKGDIRRAAWDTEYAKAAAKSGKKSASKGDGKGKSKASGTDKDGTGDEVTKTPELGLTEPSTAGEEADSAGQVHENGHGGGDDGSNAETGPDGGPGDDDN